MRLLLAFVLVLVVGLLAADLRTDFLWRGVVCVEQSTQVEREGVKVVRCANGERYRVSFQLPCSETLSCEIGVSCVDTLEHLAR
jgi:hypothetical protein